MLPDRSGRRGSSRRRPWPVRRRGRRRRRTSSTPVRRRRRRRRRCPLPDATSHLAWLAGSAEADRPQTINGPAPPATPPAPPQPTPWPRPPSSATPSPPLFPARPHPIPHRQRTSNSKSHLRHSNKKKRTRKKIGCKQICSFVPPAIRTRKDGRNPQKISPNVGSTQYPVPG